MARSLAPLSVRYSENGMTKMTTDPRIEAIAKAFKKEFNNGWLDRKDPDPILSAIQTLLDDGVIALPERVMKLEQFAVHSGRYITNDSLYSDWSDALTEVMKHD